MRAYESWPVMCVGGCECVRACYGPLRVLVAVSACVRARSLKKK